MGKKPKLSRKLIGVSADVGDNVELNATVEGSPLPTVTWFRNGQALIGHQASVTIIDNDKAHLRLSLENVKVCN